MLTQYELVVTCEDFTSVPILVKIDQEMRRWECAQTDRQTNRREPVFTRDSIYAIARICYGNSVCLSVCHTGGSVKNG